LILLRCGVIDIDTPQLLHFCTRGVSSSQIAAEFTRAGRISEA